MKTLTAITLLLLVTTTVHSADPAGLKKLTGEPARIVWVQDLGEKGSDTFAEGNQLQLMGYCTEDRYGERIIIKGPGSFTKPLMSSDGRKVIFTDAHAREIYSIDFNGKNKRFVAKGYALDTRLDPATGIDWLYYGSEQTKGKGVTFSRVNAVPISDKGKHTEIWTIAPVSMDNFQVSRDGTRAAGLFPWPSGGVAQLPNGKWKKYHRGCWTSLAPDNSCLFWIFDGQHRNLTMKFSESDPGWSINIADKKHFKGYEVYHPRWSNHPRLMTLTGPYLGGKGRPGGNFIREGGTAVEIYVGKFSADYRQVEAWNKVSDNDRADFYPDLWVEGGEKASISDTLKIPAQPAETASETEQTSADGIIFAWKNSRVANQIPTESGAAVQCRVSEHGYTRYGPNYELELSHGSARAVDADSRLLKACRASNELTIEAYITPANITQFGPARIITFSTDAHSRNFTLGQSKDRLIMRLRTTSTGLNGMDPEADLCELKAGKGHHVIVTYADDILTCYLNGKRVERTKDIKGSFANWSEQALLFGDESNGQRNWDGRLENINIYSRALDRKEAEQAYEHFAETLSERTPLEAVIVEAELISLPEIRAPEAILPYVRLLAENRYKITKVIQGKINEDEIAVANWVILEGKKIEKIPTPGTKLRLHLFPMDSQPQLKGEKTTLDEDNVLLDVYYDPRPIDLIPVLE